MVLHKSKLVDLLNDRHGNHLIKFDRLDMVPRLLLMEVYLTGVGVEKVEVVVILFWIYKLNLPLFLMSINLIFPSLSLSFCFYFWLLRYFYWMWVHFILFLIYCL